MVSSTKSFRSGPDEDYHPARRRAASASAESSRQPDDLAIKAVEAVMRHRLAGSAYVRSAAEPAHMGAPGRPFDEGLDAGRLGELATVLGVVNHKRPRQRRRRAQDRH